MVVMWLAVFAMGIVLVNVRWSAGQKLLAALLVVALPALLLVLWALLLPGKGFYAWFLGVALSGWGIARLWSPGNTPAT